MAVRRLTGRAGFTLVESVISVLIVGLVMVAALDTLGAVARARSSQRTPNQYDALGRQLLGEILQAPYEDADQPGGWGIEAGEDDTTRADFDDLDDYDGWSTNQLQDKDGTQLAGCDGLQRSVDVYRVHPQSPYSIMASDTGLRLVRVHVYDSVIDTLYAYYALRAKLGACEKTPAYDTTFVAWTGVELQIGTVSTGQRESAVNIVNQPESVAP